MKKTILNMAFALCACFVYAQNDQSNIRLQGTPAVNNKVVPTKGGTSPLQATKSVQNSSKIIVPPSGQRYSVQDPQRMFSDLLDLKQDMSFQQARVTQTRRGAEYHKYQLYYQGVKIEFGTVTVKSERSEVKFINTSGYVIPDGFSISPALSAQDGFSRALAHVDAVSYLWQDEEASAELGYQKPTGELVILPVLSEDGYEVRLAYKYDIHTISPLGGGDYYVDAQNGEILFFNNRFYHNDKHRPKPVIAHVETEAEYQKRMRLEGGYLPVVVLGTAETRYSGTRSIETRDEGPNYSLNDDSRSVFTRDAQNVAPGSFSLPYLNSYAEFTDNDNNWTQAEHSPGDDDVALDAHYGMIWTYDYWINVHGRDSFDNAGTQLRSYVHVGNNYNNAFWWFDVMSYGDGDGSLFNPLTSMDVCAHEMGHGVTQYTSNLAYQLESGAMNEGFSDIWGAAVEHYAKGTGTNADPDDNVWLVGEEIMANGSEALRSMSDPKSQGQPDTYGGDNWINVVGCTPSNGNDQCGVHTNSGVLNHWFYLLTEGGSGTNDNNDDYSVNGIGMMAAEELAYDLLLALNANDTHALARTASIAAAQSIYGPCSVEEKAVTNAWYAVGVGAAFVNTCVPAVYFAASGQTQDEGTDCNYLDIVINVDISIAATDDADISFNQTGGTAQAGVDYQLITSSVTIPGGSTAAQPVTIRIFRDPFEEADESLELSLIVDPNLGNAVADPLGDDVFTLNLNNDDNPLLTQEVIAYQEDFESAPFQVTQTSVGNSDGWLFGDNGALTSGFWTTNGNSTDFAYSNDDNCNCNKSDDRLYTDPFSLVGYTAARLNFDHAFADLGENGLVYIDHDNDGTFNLISILSNSSVSLGGGSYDTPWVNADIDLTAYIGQPIVRLLFRYMDGGAWAYGMAVDNITIFGEVTNDIQTAVNTGGPDQKDILGSGTLYSGDPSTGFRMVDIQNNDSFDYQCTSIAVSRAGTGAQAYNGSLLPYHVLDKTFTITPTTTNASGDTQITFYIAASELTGWEAATGLSRNDLIVGRGSASTITETSSLSMGTFGSGFTFTGTFTGLDGNFYFGHPNSFASCPGGTKTWDGSNWSPAGAPGLTNAVVIDGDYNTDGDGFFNACSLVVNVGATLTINTETVPTAPVNYVNVDNSVTVNGTLLIEHEGSLVQVDDDGVALNNGTVNVVQTTPVLGSRDFMILGSPMAGETRSDVWSAAFLVLDHTTANFVPHPQVAIDFPGAENFADDNYDNWNSYNGAINPGEGYIVRPQAGFGQPGGSFTYTYDTGNINNGVVNFDVVYNDDPNTSDPDDDKNYSPNVAANPYPSAISADAFITANDMVDEIFFWEHITPPSTGLPGAGNMNFSMEDISMRNLSGGVAATNYTGPSVNSTTYNQYIATGQGFGFKANLQEVINNGGTAADKLIFNNAMRVTGHNTNLRNPVAKDRIWLEIGSVSYNVTRSTLVAFLDEATPLKDSGYDSRRLATVVSLYSHLEDGTEQLGIQAREPFEPGMKVPMGFSTQIDEQTTYKISIANLEGENLEAATVYLRDNLSPYGELHNLSDGPYVFNSGKGTFHNRFTILFESEPVLSTPDLEHSIGLYPNPTDGMLNIYSSNNVIEQIKLYDVLGREVKHIAQVNDLQLALDLSDLNQAIYLLKIQTDAGTVTKQVIKR